MGPFSDKLYSNWTSFCSEMLKTTRAYRSHIQIFDETGLLFFCVGLDVGVCTFSGRVILVVTILLFCFILFVLWLLKL